MALMQDACKVVSEQERKSVSLNMEYKNRLNNLCEIVDRLHKIRMLLLPPVPEKPGPGINETKKQPQEMSFLEVWEDHTDYFDYLINKLHIIISELEQF